MSLEIDDSVLWTNPVLAVRMVQIAAYRDFQERARGFGLSPCYYALLGLIEANPGLSQTQLAERLRLVRASLVPILDKLTAEGLLERRLDPTDKRVRRVWLSPRGKKVFARLRQKADQHHARLLSGFGNDEKQIFLQFLRRADANLNHAVEDIDSVA